VEVVLHWFLRGGVCVFFFLKTLELSCALNFYSFGLNRGFFLFVLDFQGINLSGLFLVLLVKDGFRVSFIGDSA
jgi:hypothetical protein